MSNLAALRGVGKTFGGGFSLNNINLEVPEGCVVGMVGANGAGKTTIIRVLMGLTRIDAGSIELFGEPFGADIPTRTARRCKDRIGIVLDTCPFPTEMTLGTIGPVMQPVYSNWDQKRFEKLCRDFDLDPAKKAKDISRGMGMKLQIACALSHDPLLLVLDEATAGLDPIMREEVLDMLRDFMADERHGILMSSHITTDLEKVADYIVMIENGRLTHNLEKDSITSQMGTARCRTSELDAILGSGLFGKGELRIIRNGYNVDVLVPDRHAFAARFPEIPCDRTSVDDFMQFQVKGEAR